MRGDDIAMTGDGGSGSTSTDRSSMTDCRIGISAQPNTMDRRSALSSCGRQSNGRVVTDRQRTPWRCRLGAGAIVVAVAVGMLLAPAVQARADVFRHDPASCATGAEGTVTVAFGRTVFQLLIDDLRFIRGLPPEARAEDPDAPDPTQPVGCPDNPLRVPAFTIGYPPDAVRESRPDQPLRLDWLVHLDWLTLFPADSSHWGPSSNSQLWFARVCQRYGLREVLENGLVVCTVRPDPPRDATISPDDWPYYVQLPLEEAFGPYGGMATVQCRWGFGYLGGPSGANRCDADYRITEALHVRYRFQPRNLPISDLIAFDRELRAWIASVHVEDFVWPDQPPGIGVDQ